MRPESFLVKGRYDHIFEIKPPSSPPPKKGEFEFSLPFGEGRGEAITLTNFKQPDNLVFTFHFLISPIIFVKCTSLQESDAIPGIELFSGFCIT